MKFAKLRDVKTPSRGTNKSAGIDFYIPNDHEPITLGPHESIKIPSGIMCRIKPGCALVPRNKSGIAIGHQVIVGADVIDEDYTGEMGLHIINTSKNPVSFQPGQKIIQMILLKVDYETLDEEVSPEALFLDFETERGDGKEGSTGLF